MALRGVTDEQPLEILRLSLIRAQFGETLVSLMTPRRAPKYVFLCGMFSMLHIALDRSMAEMLEEINVAPEVRDSLLLSDGPFSDLLAFFVHYENGRWDNVTEFGERNGLTSEQISNTYLGAVRWFEDLVNS